MRNLKIQIRKGGNEMFSTFFFAFGSWLLAFGSWLLAFGFWLLALGFWLFFLLKSKKKGKCGG